MEATNIIFENVKCNLCNEDNEHFLFKTTDKLHGNPGTFNIVKCNKCGLVYINPRPQDISGYYPEDYTPFNIKQNDFFQRIYSNLMDAYYSKSLNLIIKMKGLLYKLIYSPIPKEKRGRILDIGCGNGNFLYDLKKHGWETYGIDMSEKAVTFAKDKLELKNVFCGKLEDAEYQNNYFDVITLNHVIEHLPDPKKTLEIISRILKDDGMLIITTPDTDSFNFKLFKDNWFPLETPRHLNLFNSSAMENILSKTGFSLQKSKYNFSTDQIMRSINYFAKGEIIKNLRFFFLPLTIFLSLLKKSDVVTFYATKSLAIKYNEENKNSPAERPVIKILFVNMVNPINEVENLYPPLGPTYLAAYVKKHMDPDQFEFSMISSDFKKSISDIRPDIVGITSVTQNYNAAKEIARFSKEIGIKHVLIGGSHISLYPMSLDRNIDIGIIGEGELTFFELMKTFEKKKGFNLSKLPSIEGIAYHDNGKVKLNTCRELIKNLDDIPMPDRSLFRIDPEKAYIFSSRGCPYRCIFCASSRLWKRTRFHSAEYVLREIKELIEKWKVKKIDFYDDLFIADKSRIKELAKLMKRDGISGKVCINVSARANLIDDEICALLKEMGVTGISMGLESGSREILTYLKGGSVTVEDNANAIKTIKKHGMYCNGSFVIGAPIDTRETILETLDFIKKSQLDEFMVYALTPLPGTPIWDYAVTNKLVSEDPDKVDWSKFDVEYDRAHKNNIHLAKNLSRDEFYQLFLLFEKEKRRRNIRRAIKLLFTNPTRFFYHINKKMQSFLLKK